MLKEKKKINEVGAFLCLLIPFCILGVGAGFLKLNPEILMLTIASLVGIVCVFLGYSWDDIISTIVEKIKKAMPSLFILVIIGMLIGAWMIGGTIPMMITIGLKIINPSFLAVTSFLVSAFISVCVGTSWGTVGTIGVALIGVATAMNAPLPIIAGAIISGAYFGDKMSPLSDTTNLSPLAAGAELYEHIWHMLYTTVPSAILCIIVYTIVGLNLDLNNSVALNSSKEVIDTLNSIYDFNFLIILPVIIILYGSITKKPTIPVMLLSSFLALFNAMFFQGFSLTQCAQATMTGFNVSMIQKEGFEIANISKDILILLNRGGMSSMANTLLLTFCAFSFGGLLELTGTLNIVLKKLVKSIKSVGTLVMCTLACGTICLAIMSNGSITTFLIGDMFRQVYLDMGLHLKNLSRTIEDSVTVVDPLIPWTPSGVYMSTTLGVATFAYAPWAILCYFGYVVATTLAFTGFGIAKLKPESVKINVNK